MKSTYIDSAETPLGAEAGAPEADNGLGVGKRFRDCTEAEQLKRIDHSRKLLHKAMEGWDHLLPLKRASELQHDFVFGRQGSFGIAAEEGC